MSAQFSQHDPWFILGKVLDAKTPPILLYGPPGTGKSLTPCLWAQEHNWAFFSVTLTEETPTSELRGHFVLKGQEFIWHDGLIARAWRLSHTRPQGIVVVLNEIDHAGADVQSFLHNALDDPSMVRMDLPGDETLTPAVGKVIYGATMNGRAEDLPDARRDRFPVTIAMPTPNPQASRPCLPTSAPWRRTPRRRRTASGVSRPGPSSSSPTSAVPWVISSLPSRSSAPPRDDLHHQQESEGLGTRPPRRRPRPGHHRPRPRARTPPPAGRPVCPDPACES